MMLRPDLKWMLLEDDGEIRRKVWLGYDDKGNFRAAHVVQEVDDILDANAEAEKATHGQRFGDFRRVASLPVTAFEQLGIGDAVDAQDRRYLSKILNSSDYAKFRTSRGKF